MLALKIIKINYLQIILAIILTVLLFNVITDLNKYVFYNNLFKIKNQNILSDTSIELIILTVTGDKKFLNPETIIVYKDLYIIHLLVLSGSNLVIFKTFLTLFRLKDNISHFIIILLSILTYYCYINYLHPVARAFIFMTIDEYLDFKGFKFSSFSVIFIKISLCFITLLYFEFSSSFLLSLLFSLLIVIYNSIFSFKTRISTFFSTFILFPIFMTVFSIPIQIYFFNDFNIITSLFSNILISSVYDYLVFLCYIGYFIGFIENISGAVLPPIDFILNLIFSYLTYIHYLNKLYN